MRIKTTEMKVYTFDELTDKAKQKAINDYVNFLLETQNYETASDNFKKAIDKAEAMQTPWFAGSYIFEYCREEILDDIKENNYEFEEAGNLV